LVVDKKTLYVVDAGNHRIQRFDVSEDQPRLIDIWGKEGNQNGQFYYPYDLALASDGTVLVCEYGNQRLQRFDHAGKWIASWGGPGFEPGQLYQPWGLTIDSHDRVHILDSNNHRVQRIGLPT
jgi:sugar lactone lactonase YvrE